MPGLGCGCVAYYAGTSAASADKVEELFRKEIDRIVSSGLTEEEFENARNKIIFRLDNAMQAPDKLLNTAVSSEFIGRGYLDAFRKRETLKLLDIKEVNAVLKKYLSQKNSVTVLSHRKRNSIGGLLFPPFCIRFASEKERKITAFFRFRLSSLFS